MTTHTHVWHSSVHHDGCHAYETIYSCLCGAERHVGAERDPEEDPYSAVWMLDQECARCKELLTGVEADRWDDVVEVA